MTSGACPRATVRPPGLGVGQGRATRWTPVQVRHPPEVQPVDPYGTRASGEEELRRVLPGGIEAGGHRPTVDEDLARRPVQQQPHRQRLVRDQRDLTVQLLVVARAVEAAAAPVQQQPDAARVRRVHLGGRQDQSSLFGPVRGGPEADHQLGSRLQGEGQLEVELVPGGADEPGRLPGRQRLGAEVAVVSAQHLDLSHGPLLQLIVRAQGQLAGQRHHPRPAGLDLRGGGPALRQPAEEDPPPLFVAEGLGGVEVVPSEVQVAALLRLEPLTVEHAGQVDAVMGDLVVPDRDQQHLERGLISSVGGAGAQPEQVDVLPDAAGPHPAVLGVADQDRTHVRPRP